MNTINISVKIDKHIDAEVSIDEVISTINHMPTKQKWNCIAKFLYYVYTDLSKLDDEEKTIIKEYLTKKLALFV